MNATELDNTIKAADAYHGAVADGKSEKDAINAACDAYEKNQKEQFYRKYPFLRTLPGQA